MALTDPATLVEDLETYLGLGTNIDPLRALLMVDLSLQRVGAVVTPVPDAARAIVLDVAARGYSNPQGTSTEQVGPFSRTFRMPGVYLTARERSDLRRMRGSGGAFTVNPITPFVDTA